MYWVKKNIYELANDTSKDKRTCKGCSLGVASLAPKNYFNSFFMCTKRQHEIFHKDAVYALGEIM